ncbi:MAG: B12-binding domain-containing radical SAM protein [Kiritimatiellaeota bacterium]|nr:B12-binding domain-containing radical SAM protein [Kiritimatiellota bacterium]
MGVRLWDSDLEVTASGAVTATAEVFHHYGAAFGIRSNGYLWTEGSVTASGLGAGEGWGVVAFIQLWCGFFEAAGNTHATQTGIFVSSAPDVRAPAGAIGWDWVLNDEPFAGSNLGSGNYGPDYEWQDVTWSDVLWARFDGSRIDDCDGGPVVPTGSETLYLDGGNLYLGGCAAAGGELFDSPDWEQVDGSTVSLNGLYWHTSANIGLYVCDSGPVTIDVANASHIMVAPSSSLARRNGPEPIAGIYAPNAELTITGVEFFSVGAHGGDISDATEIWGIWANALSFGANAQVFAESDSEITAGGINVENSFEVLRGASVSVVGVSNGQAYGLRAHSEADEMECSEGFIGIAAHETKVYGALDVWVYDASCGVGVASNLSLYNGLLGVWAPQFALTNANGYPAAPHVESAPPPGSWHWGLSSAPEPGFDLGSGRWGTDNEWQSADYSLVRYVRFELIDDDDDAEYRTLFLADGNLYTGSCSGTPFAPPPGTGSWERVGPNHVRLDGLTWETTAEVGLMVCGEAAVVIETVGASSISATSVSRFQTVGIYSPFAAVEFAGTAELTVAATTVDAYASAWGVLSEETLVSGVLTATGTTPEGASASAAGIASYEGNLTIGPGGVATAIGLSWMDANGVWIGDLVIAEGGELTARAEAFASGAAYGAYLWSADIAGTFTVEAHSATSSYGLTAYDFLDITGTVTVTVSAESAAGYTYAIGVYSESIVIHGEYPGGNLEVSASAIEGVGVGGEIDLRSGSLTSAAPWLALAEFDDFTGDFVGSAPEVLGLALPDHWLWTLNDTPEYGAALGSGQWLPDAGWQTADWDSVQYARFVMARASLPDAVIVVGPILGATNGVAQNGDLLTAQCSSPTPGATVTYQWLLDGAVVSSSSSWRGAGARGGPQRVNAARGDARPPNIRPPDRSIFAGRDYGPLNLVETSRGCRFQCEFCSITKFFKQTYTARPLDDVIAEIKTLPKSLLFFVDDNLAMDIERLKALCRALKPLRKRWLGQLSVHAAHDEALLALMAESGCAGVLIGFESLHAETLQDMGKQVNASHNDFRTAIANLRRHHISIYATFVFGYDHDTEESFEATYRFALENKFFFAAFNHLVPFPGTDVYERLRKEGRLLYEAWWRRDDVRFGDVVFRPKNFTPERLAELCQKYRLKFYSLPSILRRGNDYAANVRGLRKVLYFYIGNLTQEREVMRRKGLPFGGEP